MILFACHSTRDNILSGMKRHGLGKIQKMRKVI